MQISKMMLAEHSTAKKSLRDAHSEFLNLVSSAGDGNIRLNITERVAEVVLNYPAKRNAISGRMMSQFADIVDTIAPAGATLEKLTQSDLVGLIIRGTGGGAFCAGADLNLVKEVVNSPEKGVMMSDFMTDACNRLRQSPLISVCCLNGPALGGGAELATIGDFRIISEPANSYIQFVHAKIGASPGWGGARRLMSIVGRRHAIRIAASSVAVYPLEAQRMGLVDDIIPNPSIDLDRSTGQQEDAYDVHYSSAAHEFLHPYLAQNFPGSIRAIKVAVAASEDVGALEAKQLERDMFQARWFGKDNKKGLHNPSVDFFKQPPR